MTPQHPSSAPLGRRDRKKQELSAELARQAMLLFEERGYDNVNVEDITEAADVSRTTFFRHYRSKEEVLLRWMTDIGDEAAEALLDRPADEPVMVAVREAVTRLAALYAQNESRADLLDRLRRESPAVRTAYRDKLAYWEDALARAIAQRTGIHHPAALYPKLASRLAMAVISSGSDSWTVDHSEPVEVALDRAFTVIDETALEKIFERDRALGWAYPPGSSVPGEVVEREQ